VRAFEQDTAVTSPRARSSNAVVPGLVEPLSDRKLEVLRLLAAGRAAPIEDLFTTSQTVTSAA
jgi:hypothetical protein